MSINRAYRNPDEMPAAFPIFPLAGALLLPRGELPLSVFEQRYLAMVDDAMRGPRIVGMIQPDPEAGAGTAVPALFSVGCAGRITQLAETGDGRYFVTLTGIARFKIVEEIAATTPSGNAAPISARFPSISVPARARIRSIATASCALCAISPRPTISRSTGIAYMTRQTRHSSMRCP